MGYFIERRVRAKHRFMVALECCHLLWPFSCCFGHRIGYCVCECGHCLFEVHAFIVGDFCHDLNCHGRTFIFPVPLHSLHLSTERNSPLPHVMQVTSSCAPYGAVLVPSC